MAAPAERMKAMRERRRARGLRELRLVLPDARSSSVRRRIAKEVASLRRSDEDRALRWIETISEFDSFTKP
jgi:Antitoxin MazE-like